MVEEFVKLKSEANSRMDKSITFLKDEMKKMKICVLIITAI